jgi:hypothetical protein
MIRDFNMLQFNSPGLLYKMRHLKSIYCLVITSKMLGIIVLNITYVACLKLLTEASTGGDHCWRIT